MTEQERGRTYHSKAARDVIITLAVSTVGLGVGTVLGGLVGYAAPLGLFGLFTPIVIASAIKLQRIHEVKKNAA